MSMRAIGPYQPLEELTDNDGYTSYRAIDPRLFGQPVVLTVTQFRTDLAGFGQTFEAGARALTTLRHPTILPVSDFGETLDYLYLISPYLEAPTVATMIGQPRRPVEALSLIATIADALDYAHQRDLPHGNLTPAAIQLTNLPPGEDTLFAAWPLLRYHGFTPLLQQEPPEDSPYRPAGDDETPASIDRYALAAILYALLTGQPPADNDLAGLASVPDELANVVRRALAPDPAQRYTSGAELVLALREGALAVRRTETQVTQHLLDEAREAVAQGKLRAASEAYRAYLHQRPDDEMARREFTTIEGRRAEIARRRAESLATVAAVPPPAPTPTTTEATVNTTNQQPVGDAAPERPGDVGWSVSSVAYPDSATSRPGQFPYSSGPRDLTGGITPGSLQSVSTRQAARGATPRDFKPIAAPARLRRQAILPTVIAALGFLVVLALLGVLISRQRSQQAATQTVAAVGIVAGSPSAQTASGSPTRVATNVPPVIPIAPTIAPPTLTPVPTLPPLQPVFVDTFGDPNTGFPREPGGIPEAGYHTGEYVLLVRDPDAFEVAELTSCNVPAVPDCNFGDMVVEVDIHAVGPTAGGSYGLVFHRRFAGAYVQYFVLIDPEQGTIRLVLWNDVNRVELIPPTPLVQIAKGEAVNHLTVTVKGHTITVGVNGANLPTVTDPNGPLFGLVALRADSAAGPIDVRFDNFTIRPVR